MIEKPLFTLRPNIAVAIIPIILVALFMGFWASFFSISLGIGVSVIIGVSIAMIITIFRLLNLNARKYIFYPQKAEFYEGFLNIIQRTVHHNKVTDCILTKSVWDRLFGTGTISLATAGHQTTARGALGGGINLQYLDKPDKLYKELQRLLNKH